MSSHTIEDLTSCILDFQANMMRVTYRMKITLVEPQLEDSHAAALKYIWASSRVDEEVINVDIYKWRKIGLDSEDVTQEFREVGVLGLQCLVRGVGLVGVDGLLRWLCRDNLWRRTPTIGPR